MICPPQRVTVSHVRKLLFGNNHFTGHYWLLPYLYWPNFHLTFTRLSKRHFCSLVVGIDHKFDSESLLFSIPSSEQASDDRNKNINRYRKHAFVLIFFFLILQMTWDVLINGSEERSWGKIRLGSQKHLICYGITWLCAISKLHQTVRSKVSE